MTSDEIKTIDKGTRIYCIGHKSANGEYYFPPCIGIIQEKHPLFKSGDPNRHTSYMVQWLNSVRQTSGEDNTSLLGDEILLIRDDKHLLVLQLQHQ